MTRFDLHQGLGYQLSRAARVNNQPFEAALGTLGLTRQMWCVLVAVGEQGLTRPSDIARYIGIVRAAVSRTLRTMERDRLINRSHADGDDGRATTITLTAEGQARLAASLPMAQDNRARLDEFFTPSEREQLFALLARLDPTTDAPGI